MQTFIRFTLVSLLVISAKIATAVNNDVPPYCSDPRYDSTEITITKGNYADAGNQKKNTQFQIFYPSKKIDTSKSRAFILYLHGGGFSSGTYSSEANKCREFAERGYVAVSINYFISQWQTSNCNAADTPQLFTNIYKGLQDAHAAMRYFCFHAKDYKIDTSKMFVGGTSAGSIIALFTAFLDQSEANADLGTHASLGGIDQGVNSIQIHFTVKGVTDASGAVRYSSDIDANEKIPVVSFHATGDPVVPYAINSFFWGTCGNTFPPVYGSSVIYSRLVSLGICAELNYDSSNNHGGFKDDYIVRHTSCFFHSTWIQTCQTQQFNYKKNIIPSCCNGHREEGLNGMNNMLWAAFPNPANNEIQFNLPATTDQYIVQIFSGEGLQVKEFRVSGLSESRIPTSSFPQGIYFYLVRNQERQLYTGKFVVLH